MKINNNVTKKFYLFAILIITFIISCEKILEDPASISETTIEANKTASSTDIKKDISLGMLALSGDYKVPVAEAQQQALEIAQEFRNLEGVTTKAPITISSIEKIKGNSKKLVVNTKAEDENKKDISDMYLINFENNQGYVLMSADRRVSGTLAYSSNGHLGDTINNPVQQILLEQSVYFLEQERKKFEARKKELSVIAEEYFFKKLPQKVQDSLIKNGMFDKNGNKIITKVVPINRIRECELRSYTIEGDWKIVEKKVPLMRTLWGQGEGYNNFVPMTCPKKGGRVSVGCVATAVGQIMAYHKKPTYFKGRKMDWVNMIYLKKENTYRTAKENNAGGDISHLLFRLGDSDLLDMEYDCNGSGASDDDALKTFRYLGYRNVKKIGYNDSKVISEIRNDKPVYISGSSQNKKIKRCFLWWCWTTESHSNGHAWVLDGYVRKEKKVTTVVEYVCGTRYKQVYNGANVIELVHNNFGWGYYGYNDGKGTGWYNKGIFNSNKRKERSDAFGTTKSKEDGNYKYQNVLIININ